MSGSPTTRSLAKLRADGYTAEVVERRVPFSNTTKDLFGFIDILAVRGAETLAVQTTSKANISARRRKINAADALPVVLAAGWRVVIHGWHQARPRARWNVTVIEVGA